MAALVANQNRRQLPDHASLLVGLSASGPITAAQVAIKARPTSGANSAGPSTPRWTDSLGLWASSGLYPTRYRACCFQPASSHELSRPDLTLLASEHRLVLTPALRSVSEPGGGRSDSRRFAYPLEVCNLISLPRKYGDNSALAHGFASGVNRTSPCFELPLRASLGLLPEPSERVSVGWKRACSRPLQLVVCTSL